MSFTIPPNEYERIAALHHYRILDTHAEEAFDRVTRVAVRLFGVQGALITFVDEQRQWVKSWSGKKLRETARGNSFCTQTILSDEVLTIPNALADPRFADIPIVRELNGVKFYSGAPLTTKDGHRLGSLCLIDSTPRAPLDDEQERLLKDLASIVVDELDLRLSLATSREEIDRRVVLEHTLESTRKDQEQIASDLAEAQRKLRADLSRAARVQMELLPKGGFEAAGVEISAGFRPALDVGGDFFDWYESDNGKVTFSLGDVSGKGMPAALLMTTLLATLRSVVRDATPDDAIRYLQRTHGRALDKVRAFATVFLGQLDPTTGAVRFVDAGHGLTFIYRMTGTWERLTPRGLPLGIESDEVHLEGHVSLQDGDALVIFSDGFMHHDTTPPMEFARISDAMRGARSAREMTDRILAIHDTGQGLGEDDQAVLVLRRTAR